MLPVISRNWFPTLFDVFDADILCGIRFSAGFAALHQRLSIVKHLRRFHRNICQSLANHAILTARAVADPTNKGDSRPAVSAITSQ